MIPSLFQGFIKQNASLFDELARLLDLLIEKYITEQDYVVRRANLTKKIDHLREALVKPAQELEDWRVARTELSHLGDYLVREFKAGNIEKRRSILQRTVEDIVATNRRCVVKLKFPYRLAAEAHDDNGTLQLEKSHKTQSPQT